MKEFERDDFSDGTEEIMSGKDADRPLDYCDVCFIAFGSQEKRISIGKSIVHPDCANKAKLKKTF
jgi:hypothetical protein